MRTVLAVVAAVVLVVLTAPLLRVVADREFRRLFPKLALAIGAVVAAWVAVVVAVAALWPEGLVPLAIVALAVAAVFAWRARGSYGARRELPPGTLSLTSSLRDLAHRDAYARAAEHHGPVFKAAQFNHRVVCVVGIDRAQRLMREHVEAIGPSPLPFAQQLMGGFLRYMDDDRHDVYGPLFRRGLSPAVVAATEPVARAAARRELDGLPVAMHPAPARADALDPHLQRIAHESVVSALFGLRAGTERFEQYDVLAHRFARSTIMHPLNRRSLATLGELRALVASLDPDTALRSSQAPCALSELRAQDARMPDEVCIDNLLMMAKIGTNNVVGLLRWMVVLLSDAPDWWVDAPDAFVMETLRLAQSEYVYRRLTADIDFEGHRLPKGWLLRVCVAESHRDPRVFTEPEQMTDRFAGRRPNQTEFCPFGFGRHACNAAGLSMMIGRSVLIELARSPELVVFHDGQLTREPRHWSHWRPASPLGIMFRVAEPAEL